MAIIKMGVQDDASEIKYDNTTSGLTSTTVQGAIDDLSNGTPQQVYNLNGEPNGFNRNEPDSMGDLSYNSSTKIFTIEPKDGEDNFYFYSESILYTYTTAKTVVLSNVSGLHVIYFDNNGDLLQATDFSNFTTIVTRYCIVAYIYLNTDESTWLGIGDERHGIHMTGATHYYLHNTEGARYLSGMTPDLVESYVTFGTNGISSGSFLDEDILHELSQQTTFKALHLATNNKWTYTYVSNNLGIPYGATGHVAYNYYDDQQTQWTQAEVTGNDHIIMHMIATNHITEGYGYMLIQGQNLYDNKFDARAGMEAEFNNLKTIGLPSAEFIFIGSYIINSSGQLITNDDDALFTDWRINDKTRLNGLISDHTQLVNRTNDDAHPISAITNLQTSLDGKLSVPNYVIKNSNYTAVSGDQLWVDTSSNAITITLPASPSANDFVDISDYAGTFGTNSLTLGRNGSNMMGDEADIEVTDNNMSMRIIYVDSTQGWRLI